MNLNNLLGFDEAGLKIVTPLNKRLVSLFKPKAYYHLGLALFGVYAAIKFVLFLVGGSPRGYITTFCILAGMLGIINIYSDPLKKRVFTSPPTEMPIELRVGRGLLFAFPCLFNIGITMLLIPFTEMPAYILFWGIVCNILDLSAVYLVTSRGENELESVSAQEDKG